MLRLYVGLSVQVINEATKSEVCVVVTTASDGGSGQALRFPLGIGVPTQSRNTLIHSIYDTKYVSRRSLLEEADSKAFL